MKVREKTKLVNLFVCVRNEAAFNEKLVDTIATDLNRQLKPLWLRVVGRFHPRGGIGVTATAERGNQEHRPQ